MHKDDGAAGPDASDPRTYFENMSHREMLQMLEGADHTRVSALADRLHDVAHSIDQIGTDLKTHMSNVEWSGEAGDAFRGWGGRVASATFTLSDYSKSAGTQMSNAAHILAEVQRDMPPVPQDAINTAVTYRQSKKIDGPFSDAAEGATPTVCMPDPSSTDYQQALTAMETDRTKAVDAMAKLGGAYQGATEVMSKQDQPSFPPPPDDVMPPRPSLITEEQYVRAPEGPIRSNGRSHEDELVSGGEAGEDSHSARPFQLDGGTHPSSDTEPVGGSEGARRPDGATPFPLTSNPGERLPSVEVHGPTGIGAAPESPTPGHPVVAPSGDGIQGGRLVEGPTGGIGGARLSQGTVIGGEEPPGVAVNAGRYGAASAPAWERSSDEFTRGGSGLAASREQELSEARPGMPMTGGMGFGGRTDRGRNSSRPDYLVEDEETWTPGDPKVVPSVLE